MIVFNGVDLETAVPSIKIEDIHVSAPQVLPVVRERAVSSGSLFVRSRYGIRTITITFAVLVQPNLRGYIFDDIAQWAASDEPKPLVLPYHQNRIIYAICTQLPSPHVRKWWENVQMTFTCYDPFFYSASSNTALNWSLKAVGSTFNAYGDVPPLMHIEATNSSAASNPVYSNGTQSMYFDSIPAGDLVIDLENQLITVNGNSIMSHFYPFLGEFIIPALGAQTITGPSGIVTWVSRWLT